MTGKDAAYIAGTLFVGFLAFRVYKTASNIAGAGGKVLDAAVPALKEIITKDLNPASTQNVVYKAANVITGGDNSNSSLGTRIYEWFNPDPMSPAKIAPVQTNTRPNSVEELRRSEIIARNESEVAPNVVESRMVDARNTFRLDELRETPSYKYDPSDYEIWQTPLLANNTGA
jgi:hypothetical protein